MLFAECQGSCGYLQGTTDITPVNCGGGGREVIGLSSPGSPAALSYTWTVGDSVLTACGSMDLGDARLYRC